MEYWQVESPPPIKGDQLECSGVGHSAAGFNNSINHVGGKNGTITIVVEQVIGPDPRG